MEQAIEACRVHKATLLVKELSRICRSGLKYRKMLEDSNIDYIETTSPTDPILLREIKHAISSEERNKIRTRTKDALAEIKIRLERGEVHISKVGAVITSLGKPENLTDKSRQRSLEVRQAKAANNENNIKAMAFISALSSTHTLKQMTDKLNEAGFKTSRGGTFSPMQTKRLLDKSKKEV